jgi:hypothetical protein
LRGGGAARFAGRRLSVGRVDMGGGLAVGGEGRSGPAREERKKGLFLSAGRAHGS